ncbi:adenylate/guanylate cyclase domain-containing protein, partial [bacterium]|nr:adenylate/guanylate cyclase domain-containing protein [bacterium]
MDAGGESGRQGGLGGQANGGGRTAFILFTDIYRSSHLWEVFPKEYPAVLERHNRTVEETVAANGGEILKNLGDGYIALFEDAAQCADSAVAIQCAMAGTQASRGNSEAQDAGKMPALPGAALLAFSDGTEPQVRVACHGGALRRLAVGRGYFGPPLNRASRICQVCHPGQALVSRKVQVFLPGGADGPVRDSRMAGTAARPTNGFTLIDLGEHRLRDLAEPEHLFQLDHPDFALHEFPPLVTLGNRPNNLVRQPNAFIGREGELAELRQMLVGQGDPVGRASSPPTKLAGKMPAPPSSATSRLITITAPGGYGKSRLATQLCAD